MSKMVVIFEVTPFDDASKEEYLRLSASLRPLLVDHGGFLGGERFQSLSDPRKLLSINFWDSEEELEKWRNRVEHRMAQLAGRESCSIAKLYVRRWPGVLDGRQSQPRGSKAFPRRK